MRYTNAEIIKIVENEVIREDPRLADPEYRRRMDWMEKQALAARMILMGRRLQSFPY